MNPNHLVTSIANLLSRYTTRQFNKGNVW